MDGRYPDFPHHSQIHRFLREYAETFGLRERIRFGTAVQRRRAAGRSGGWDIDGEPFDALLVCNGHHWDPSFPEFPGPIRRPDDPLASLHRSDRAARARGKARAGRGDRQQRRRHHLRALPQGHGRAGLHLHPQRRVGDPEVRPGTSGRHGGARPTRGSRWACNGAWRGCCRGWSSGRMEDFGLPTPNHHFLEAHPTVSSELLLRLGSGDAVAKPDVAELLSDRVRFADGSVEEVDAIVYATGYRISFPFFDPAFISAPGNVLSLYKRMFKPGHRRPGVHRPRPGDPDDLPVRRVPGKACRAVAGRRLGAPRPGRDGRARSAATSAATSATTPRARATRCSWTTTSTSTISARA